MDIEIKIKMAKKRIQEETTKSPLYIALDVLLYEDDRESFFSSYKNKIKESCDSNQANSEFFKSKFNEDMSFSNSKEDIEKNIIDSLALIGHYYIEREDDMITKWQDDDFDSLSTNNLCNEDKELFFNFIKDEDKKEDDEKIFNIFLKKYGLNYKKGLLKTAKKTAKNAMSKLPIGKAMIEDKSLYMFCVILGLMLAGSIFHRKRSDKDPDKTNYDLSTINEAPKNEKKPSPKPAILLLLIPANKLDAITEKEILSSDKTTGLIDASVYYGCFPEYDAKDIESGMNLKEGKEVFSKESAQYVYVALSTQNGQDLIEGSSLKFSLKKCLRNRPREFTVLKIRLLENLDGVGKLNRI